MSHLSAEFWMRQALIQAQEASKYDEVPVGAVVVYENAIIGAGFNQVIQLSDPTAHAEIIALRSAARTQNNYRLPLCDLYVTLEPCMMCLGAITHARIRKVYFAATEPKSGVVCSQAQLHKSNFLNHHLTTEGGILANESSNLLKHFFKVRRAKIKSKRI